MTATHLGSLVDAHSIRTSPADWNGVSSESVRPTLRAVDTPAEDLWNNHGRSAYALARALLGNEEAAARAVVLAMTDFARSELRVPLDTVRRSVSRHVYLRSAELERETTSTLPLPAMVSLAHFAKLQRSCLALCMFGGHTYQEAAALLEVESLEAAQMLTSALRELTCLAAAESASDD